MGCTSSRSQDLPRLTLLSSDEFIQSIHDPPEYFIKSVQTSEDFIGSKKGKNDPEMSYNGPPSHLESSADVHPFWAYHGLDFYKNEVKTTKPDDPPPSLFPSTDTAHELRQIEVNEAISDLRQQVIGVIADKKSIKKKTKKEPRNTGDDSLKDLTYDEKLTIEFLESVLRAEDDKLEDFDNLSVQSLNASESNWILGTHISSHSSHVVDTSEDANAVSGGNDHPVPGLMRDIVTECHIGGEVKPVERDDSFLHKPVYLPDNDVLIVDADCEIGTNTKTQEQVEKLHTMKMSVSSLSSNSSKSSKSSVLSFLAFTQEDMPIESSDQHLTDCVTNEGFVDIDGDTCADDFVKTIYPEIHHPEYKTNEHGSFDLEESSQDVPKGGDHIQHNTPIHKGNVQINDTYVNDQLSIDTARSASAQVVRGSKVQNMVQMYDQKILESFGEADQTRRPLYRRQSEESDEQLNDIAYLLMNGTNGKTLPKKPYDYETNVTTPEVNLPQPENTNTSEDILSQDFNSESSSSILGQIKTDLVLLQKSKSDDENDDDDNDDDDDGIQESIDSGFAN